jgi:pyridoxamine 5'-phosphate oxidase
MADAFIGIRQDYALADLNEADLDDDPSRLLRTWLNQASQAGSPEPSAVCLSTVGADGMPSSRMVLLRALDSEGLVFYSNYESRKGRELESHRAACLCFWWGETQRQVRVEGYVERVSAEESDHYFASRPMESRLASAASPQSQVVSSREALEQMVSELREAHPEGVERPENWGGYRLVPVRFEFWQGRKARLHDRFLMSREEGVWKAVRLAP